MRLIPFPDFFGIHAFEKNTTNACCFFQWLFTLRMGDQGFKSESKTECGDKGESDQYSFFHLSIFKTCTDCQKDVRKCCCNIEPHKDHRIIGTLEEKNGQTYVL